MKQAVLIAAGIVKIVFGIGFPLSMSRKGDAPENIKSPRFMAARASGGCVVLGLILMAFL